MKKPRLFTLIFGLFAQRAVATSAVCQTGWDWSFNSKGQSPCQVASRLDAECLGIDPYELAPIVQGESYSAPEVADAARGCKCNTVIYSLFMACTDCQNVTIQAWSIWSAACDALYVGQYPGNIPLGTAVPNWAYVNHTAKDYFSSEFAYWAGDLPERGVYVAASTVPGWQSPTSTGLPVSGNSTGSISIISTNVPNNDGQPQTKKSPKVAAVVGGVLGGLVFLAVVGLGAWIFLRVRKKARRGTDKDHPDGLGGYTGGVFMSEHDMQPPKMRFYDPSDPSTFPDEIDHEASGEHAAPLDTHHYTGATVL